MMRTHVNPVAQEFNTSDGSDADLRCLSRIQLQKKREGGKFVTVLAFW
jgi:hypothetical protein